MLDPPFRFPQDIVAACALLCTQGLSTREIAVELRRVLPNQKMSHATAHRMLQQAVQDQYLKRKPSIDFTRLQTEMHRKALDFLVPLAIDSLVKRVAPPRHVCRVSVIREPAASQASVEAFGLMAAQVLVIHLMRTRTLGIAWGMLVNALVDGLAQVLQTPPCGVGGKYPTVQLIPVVGEPMQVATTMHEYSSTVLATRMAGLLNRQKVTVPSLAGVPAYLPRRGGEQVRRVLQSFFKRMPGYAAFLGKGGLFESLDTIVTGAGVPNKLLDGRHGMFLNERVIADGMSHSDMVPLVYGDVAGVLIPRPGLSKADAAKVRLMNKGWTGLQLADIKRCAKAANAEGRGGVIVIANEPSKAPLVHEIVRQGLVNHLVIDVRLAREFELVARQTQS